MITYIARNTINGKFYIGSTSDFKKRKRQHLKNKNNYPFQNALRKNENAFEWEIIEDTYDEPILEQALLDMWFGKEQCYNLNPYANRPSLETSIKNGKYVYENKIGIFSDEYMNSQKYIEHQRTAGKLAGEKVAKERIGFVNPEYIKSEEYRQIRVRNGLKHKENKTAICGLTPEQRIEAGRKGGKISANQKWMCTETGYVANPGNLAKYQRKNNIDTSKRIKI